MLSETYNVYYLGTYTTALHCTNIIDINDRTILYYTIFNSIQHFLTVR